MAIPPDSITVRRAQRLKDPDKYPELLGVDIVDRLGLIHQIAATEKALMHSIRNVRIQNLVG